MGAKQKSVEKGKSGHCDVWTLAESVCILEAKEAASISAEETSEAVQAFWVDAYKETSGLEFQMADHCDVCGMTYHAKSLKDRRDHRRYHDETINGLKRSPLNTDSVIWSSGPKRIIVVTPRSPRVQRRTAMNLSEIVSRNVPFSFVTYHVDEPLDERNLHIFIGAEANRLVSYLVFETRSHVWRCSWSKECEPFHVEGPIWSVGIVWVCHNQRRHGWVRAMLTAATDHLDVPSDRFGWYEPFTEDGRAMAQAICPESYFSTR